MNKLIIFYLTITVVQLKILNDQCKDPNSVYVAKVDPCPPACDSSYSKPRPKTYRRISVSGCKCLPGYIKRDSSRHAKCIKPEQCPNPICLGIYEEFKKCMNPNPRSCSNVSLPMFVDYDYNVDDTNCPPGQSGCECVPKYVRDDNDVCVSIHTCPAPVCPQNEVWNWCPHYCTFDEDCGSYLYGYIRDCPAPPPNYELMCHNPRCQCLSGYVRVEDGSCQLPEACCSVGNTTVVDCSADCDDTCSGEPYSGCLTFCRLRKCACKAGYVRNAIGNCILKEDCCVAAGFPMHSGLPITSGPPHLSSPVSHPPHTPSPAPFVSGSHTASNLTLNQSQSPPLTSLPTRPSSPSSNPTQSPPPYQYSTSTTLCPSPNYADALIELPDPSQCTTLTPFTLPPSNPSSNRTYETSNLPTDENPTVDCYVPEKGCEGDPNAVSKPCGDPCPISCDVFGDPKPQPCPSICIINGCACKPGFVINEFGKCISPDDCP